MEANDGSGADEGDVRKYFGGDKGAETGIRKEWRGRGRRGGSGILFKEKRFLVCWDGDR